MTDFVPFSQRGSEWSDIEPIDQYDGGAAPISPIAYSNECKWQFYLIANTFQ